jgi:hypothetical protein
MGRWDFLEDRKPQELKDYVLDQVADKLTEELRAFPPQVEWTDEASRRRYQEVTERTTAPELDTLRVACELARRDLLRDHELIDRYWRSGSYRELLPTDLEERTAQFVTRWLVDAALEFQERAQGKFNRRDLVALVERIEDRLLAGNSFRL